MKTKPVKCQFVLVGAAVCFTMMLAQFAVAQKLAEHLGAHAAPGVTVNVDNYVRAETAAQIDPRSAEK